MKTFSMGMNKDTELLAQPEGTYRDALNINLNYTEGSVVNEEGVYRMLSSDKFTVCGYAVLDDDRVVLFGQQQLPDLAADGVNYLYLNIIKLMFPKEDFSVVLYEDNKLNFRTTHRIQTTHRKNQAGEVLVYFTDGYYKEGQTGIPSDPTYLLDANPPRVINIDKQYKRVTTYGDSFTILYGNPRFDADNLRLTPYIGPRAYFGRYSGSANGSAVDLPSGQGPMIKTGGALKCGAYYMALAYEDDEGQTTNYFEVSPPVYITSGPEKAVPTTAVVGGTGALPTNKSITWRVTVPADVLYNKIKPAIIAKNDEVLTAYSLPAVEVDASSTAKITYTGLEDALGIAVEDIVIDDADYLVAQSITQQNNRLYLGNLKTNKDIGYQGFANQIKLNTVTQPITQFSPRMYDTTIINYGYTQMLMEWGKDIGQTFKTDGFEDNASLWNMSDSEIDYNTNDANRNLLVGYQRLLQDLQGTTGNDVRNGYKNVKLNNTMRGYRRGEIYAFYISFVMKDGTESYAYHIPGRAEKRVSPDNAGIIDEGDFLGELPNPYSHLDSYGFYTSEFSNYNEGTRICEVADTTDHTKLDDGTALDPQTTAFWENSNEVYPSIPDFQIMKTVDIATGNVVQDTGATPLSGQKVRHHKMPSNHSRQVDGYMPQADVKADYIQEQSTVIDGSGGDRTSTDPKQSVAMKTLETVNILGVQFSNIKIPKYIFDDIQGYKIYYAKRKPEDKTILGQSLAIPAHPRFASAPEQSVVQAKKGPYYRGWYLYGGLRSDLRGGLKVKGDWRPGGIQHTYGASPVFTFHDFSLLRRKADLSSATHVSAQYGVVFRHFLGGPGQFIPPCEYNKLKYAHRNDGPDYGYLYNTAAAAGGVNDSNRQCTVLPSSGWVSPELRNTTSFTVQEGITGTSYVIDISDTVKNTSFKIQDGNFDPDANSLENYQLGRVIDQEDDDDTEQGPSVEAYRLGRLQRVRAYFTGMFIGTAYVNPYDCLQTEHIIKGEDDKVPGVYCRVNWEWGNNGQYPYEFNAVSNDRTGNHLNLVVAPNSLTYIEPNSTTKLYNANSFAGATFIYNRGGESSILIGLESGLPLLRGHLPKWSEWSGNSSGTYSYSGLSRWSESQNFYFPDAPDTSHPYGGLTRHFEYQAGSGDPELNLEDPGNPGYGTTYLPESGRGMNFAMLPYKTTSGLPMAWLINLCATKTDVFQPFDRQDLVWTGYYVPVAEEDRTGYYEGTVDSPRVFGGDTYLSKYSFRTTSQSYGHSYFRLNSRDPGVKNLESADTELNTYAFEGYYSPNILSEGSDIFYKIGAGGYRRDQGDVPLSIGGLSNSYGFSNEQMIWRLNSANVTANYQADSYNTRNQITVGALMENGNWRQGTVDPVSSLFEFIVESEDNIELRHSNPVDDSTRFLGPSTPKQIIFASPINNLTGTENLLYSEHYSAVQDIKVAIPLPVSSRLKEVDSFAIRVARSTVDSGSLADGYRKFKPIDYKDIDSNRGEIQNMFSLAGTLYIHTKRAMFMTRGKEELQLAAVNAFIGSGDIFSQDPDEMGQSNLGHGGTDSRHAHITTEFGHFFVNRADRAIYNMMGGQIQRISDRGMKTWFRDNLEFKVKKYGIDLESPEVANTDIIVDATTSNYPVGFTIGYDPKYKRILITKREPVPTEEFITQFNAGNIVVIDNIPNIVPGPDATFCVEAIVAKEEGGGGGKRLQPSNSGTQFCGPIGFGNPVYFKQGGWTISYYPEKGVWGSRHSYLPDLYLSTTTEMYSVSKDLTSDAGGNRLRIWKHTNKNVPGGFYGETYPSEIEFIENTGSSEPKVFSSIYYWADSFKESRTMTEVDRKTDPGFTTFYVYNSTQISGVGDRINYLSNARLVDRIWRINDFRDLSKQETITEGSLISKEPNVAGRYTSQVISNLQNVTMFSEEGVVNPEYIDAGKSWFNKAKFMDHYLGIRLINDNSSGNLLHLHGAGANFRKSYR